MSLSNTLDKNRARSKINSNQLNMTYHEMTIPKKSGKVRKIVSPSKDLKKFQRRKLIELYDVYESMSNYLTKKTIHGFVPQRNVVTATQHHIGYDSTTMMDISNFFDNVYATSLPTSIDLTHLLHKDGYCAQGFSTSPILACIASIPMVTEIHKQLTTEFGSGNYAFTMYADDIQISIMNPTKARIKNICDIVTQCVQKSGFNINKKKTRTRFAKYGWRRILGVNVGDTEVRATRKTMRKIRAARHSNNKSSLGGLTAWSKCLEPTRKINLKPVDESTPVSSTDTYDLFE